MMSDSAASTASRMRRERSVLMNSAAGSVAVAAGARCMSRRCVGSTDRSPVNEPPRVLYAAISVRNRSLICRFSRSRRCCTVCMSNKRTPTPSKVMTARPSSVDNTPCHELKSKLRMHQAYAGFRQTSSRAPHRAHLARTATAAEEPVLAVGFQAGHMYALG
jgi:hypothetical protein